MGRRGYGEKREMGERRIEVVRGEVEMKRIWENEDGRRERWGEEGDGEKREMGGRMSDIMSYFKIGEM